MVSLLFQSCKKDSTASIDEVPMYASFEEMSPMISPDGVSSLNARKNSSSDCKLYMDQIDEKYRKIDTNIFADLVRLKAFVRENSDWLELNCDENGEYTLIPRYSNTLFSSFMGKERTFFVGSTMYKVLDEGLLYTNEVQSQRKLIDINYLDQLPTLKPEDDIHYIPTEDMIFVPQKVLCRGVGRTIIDNRSTVNRERIWFEQQVYQMNYNGSDISVFAIKIRPFQRVMGIWYWCSRAIQAHIDVKFEVKYNHQSLCENPTTKLDIPSTTTNLIEKTMTSNIPSSAILMQSSNSWAETDRSGRAFIIFKY